MGDVSGSTGTQDAHPQAGRQPPVALADATVAGPEPSHLGRTPTASGVPWLWDDSFVVSSRLTNSSAV